MDHTCDRCSQQIYKSRYVRAEFIDTKQKHTVVDKIFKMWISIFVSAVAFLIDNGREFADDEVPELGNQSSIFIKHTTSYAPWVNGLNGRNQATVDVMVEKMIESFR